MSNGPTLTVHPSHFFPHLFHSHSLRPLPFSHNVQLLPVLLSINITVIIYISPLTAPSHFQGLRPGNVSNDQRKQRAQSNIKTFSIFFCDIQITLVAVLQWQGCKMCEGVWRAECKSHIIQICQSHTIDCRKKKPFTSSNTETLTS